MVLLRTGASPKNKMTFWCLPFYPYLEWNGVDGMQCSGMEWNGIDGMQCSGVEWNRWNAMQWSGMESMDAPDG